MKPVRLLPLLAISAVCLFILKSAGLMFGGGYVLSGSAPAGAQAENPPAENAQEPAEAPAGQRENAEGRDGPDAPAGDDPRAAEADTAGADAGQPAAPGGRDEEQAPAARAAEGAEKEILESLAERREELDARAREIEMQENLIKAAEERVEARIRELKAIERRIGKELTRKDEERDLEYRKLVSLYSKMKPKEAARIFERMDIGVLAGLVRKMNARTVSPILAEMDPAVAKRVTMEIASSQNGPAKAMQSLPKITGEDPG